MRTYKGLVNFNTLKEAGDRERIQKAGISDNIYILLSVLQFFIYGIIKILIFDVQSAVYPADQFLWGIVSLKRCFPPKARRVIRKK